MRSLFIDWEKSQLILDNYVPSTVGLEPQKYMRLLRHDQVPVLSSVFFSQIKTKEKYGLVILEEVEAQLTMKEKDWDSSQFVNIIELLGSANIPDIQTALQQVCSIAKIISAADQVVIYQLMGENPEIRQTAHCGNEANLPEQLDMHDLVTLNEARYWEPGKHPSCSLYRTARASNIRYLASAPIGQNTALIGLVVIAGLGTPPAKPMIDIARLVASIIGALFQNNTHRINITSELLQQSLVVSRLATIMEQVQEGVMQLSQDLLIRGINPRLEEILGFSSREIIGEEVGKILIGNERIPESLRLVLEAKSGINIGDVRLFRRDGHPFQAMVRILPVLNNAHVDEVEIFIQDMTEKEQIRAHAQELENRAWLGELMAVFAHEVRNPINNISTGLQLMSMHLKSDDAQGIAISRMLQDCDRLEQLVKSVLSFSKPIEYQMESLDLGVLIQRLFDRQRMKLSNPKIRLELQIDPKCPMVLGHMRSLEQVFNNLVTNAIQAMGEDEGVITIKLASGTEIEGIPYVDIFVADNGPGIPKDVQGKIFQPFLTTKQNGTGLGLSIAKRIITAHKGNIQLSSFPGGTIFHIQLPATEDETRKF